MPDIGRPFSFQRSATRADVTAPLAKGHGTALVRAMRSRTLKVSILTFVLIGPPVGLLSIPLVASVEAGRWAGDAYPINREFIVYLLASYVGGGPPAAVAGATYGLLYTWLQRRGVIRMRWPFLVDSILGIGGAVIAWLLTLLFIREIGLAFLCLPAGLIAGVLAGALLRKQAAHTVQSQPAVERTR